MRLTHILAEKLGELYGLAQNYVYSQLEFQKLRIKERLAIVLANFVTAFFVFAVVAMLILFSSLALAFYLDELLGSSSMAFLIVALFYLVLAMIIYWLRKPLILKPVLQLVIQTLKEEEEEEEEEQVNSPERI